ncbi:MAG: NAD-dependent epimerase/dehydratase family protein [Deltaproteobacteria bacterium]|nr:NAD-dependent epimerase/dehydratase family protein [Deltaproteobacteria bacterium]
MKLLVTGVAGFIGSKLTERLIARGDDVVGLDNFDPFYPRETKERNLTSLRSAIRFVEGDITDRGGLDRLLAAERFDAVIHLAALAGVRPSIREPWRYAHVNVVGTAHLAEAMIARGVSRLVFASSSSVYGDNTLVPYEESQRVDEPASPYATTKRAGELMLDTFAKLHGLSSSCLRFFTVYGPRQRPEMAIHKFARAIERGEPVTLYGDGSSSRDYTYIDDVVDGVLGALDRPPVGARIYNLGGTQPVRLDALVRELGRALDKQPTLVHAPPQPGDVHQTWADVSRARSELGYAPQVPLPEGLRRFASWLRGESEW